MVLICICLMISEIKHFSLPVGHFYVFLGKLSFLDPLPFFHWLFIFLLLSCMRSLYILNINTLSDICGCKYYFSFYRLHFNFVDYFLCCTEAFSWLKSHLSIFLFVALVFCVKFKNSLLKPKSRSLLIMFSTRNFIVSSLSFKSLFQFELLFVYGVRWGLIPF